MKKVIMLSTIALSFSGLALSESTASASGKVDEISAKKWVCKSIKNEFFWKNGQW